MEILVMDAWEALKYTPIKPTYAIRVFPGNPKWQQSFPSQPLVHSPNYRMTQVYTFDDVDPSFNPDPANNIMFNERIATKMLTDFRDGKGECETLPTHCTRGKNRSPAIALALNDIFGLGQDPDRLKELYPDYTKFIYTILSHTAQKLRCNK